ncbi:hypothetical protein AAK964_05045 [Tissierella praeacuta]|uniref:hypothetical protein n=1 Tax=Tissierella praeacuta TaxID=43131 RepID=UPI003513D50C
MEFKFEEKEQYTLEDVQALVEGFKSKVDEVIIAKDDTITELTTQAEKVKELEQSNHQLNIKNLAIENGITEDLFDLIVDEDIEVVKTKIDLVKTLKKVDVDNTYKPEKKRTEDAYEKAIKSKDVETALKSKFGRLFG